MVAGISLRQTRRIVHPETSLLPIDYYTCENHERDQHHLTTIYQLSISVWQFELSSWTGLPGWPPKVRQGSQLGHTTSMTFAGLDWYRPGSFDMIPDL